MPMSVRGNDTARLPGAGRRAARGFSLIELLIVLALVAIGTGVVSLALRDGAASRLEEEGARLAALLEGARAEARASGLVVRWVPTDAMGALDGGDPSAGSGFRFVGLPASIALPQRWLNPGTSAQVVGSSAVLLGPDAILPAQRIVLSLDDRRLEIGSDGLAPFAVLPAAEQVAGGVPGSMPIVPR
jgi:general secretion pathway protein H